MQLTAPPKRGQILEIHGHRLGEKSITGEILEVIGAPEHMHFRVRWDDGRETIFYPSSDAIVRPARALKH
jgi:hypothetical protein